MIEEVKKYYAKCDGCGRYFPNGETWNDSQSISFASPKVAEHNIKQLGWMITYTLNEATGCICKRCSKEADYYMQQNL
jgi:hypothetical protein